MPHSNIITGESENDIWNTITEQLTAKKDDLDYSAQFDTGKHCVTIHIDIHPVRGEDEQNPMTSFTAPLPDETTFRFSIEKQNLKHGIGKLFGMQDVIVGHDEFDKKFLIQSNDEAKIKALLSNADISTALLKQSVIDFQIREQKIGANKEIVLGLEIDGIITEPTELRSIYEPFRQVLSQLD